MVGGCRRFEEWSVAKARVSGGEGTAAPRGTAKEQSGGLSHPRSDDNHIVVE